MDDLLPDSAAEPARRAPHPTVGPSTGDVVLRLDGVHLRVGDTVILDSVTLEVRAGQRWAILGPNGSGKSTLLRVASLWAHPSAGTVEVLGGRLGRVDVRSWRTRVGLASPALADLLRPELTALEVVVTARHGALEPWWHSYDEADRAAAARLLARFGLEHRVEHRMRTLSSGERQRVLLARAFAGDPGLVLLDEPTAGLDLGGREDLLERLAAVAGAPGAPPTVLVTHHVEEIPPGTTHALLMRSGRITAAGPLAEVLTGPALSATFGLPVRLERRGGRLFAMRDPAGRP